MVVWVGKTLEARRVKEEVGVVLKESFERDPSDRGRAGSVKRAE